MRFCNIALPSSTINEEFVQIEESPIHPITKRPKTTVHSSCISISDSVSTETSQLIRIAQHMAPRPSSLNMADNSLSASGEDAYYFQQNSALINNQTESLKSMSTIDLNMPGRTNPNDTFQIDSRTNGGKSECVKSEDSKSSSEVVEIAQLHERFSRMESSEEDWIEKEQFMGNF